MLSVQPDGDLLRRALAQDFVIQELQVLALVLGANSGDVTPKTKRSEIHIINASATGWSILDFVENKTRSHNLEATSALNKFAYLGAEIDVLD